MPTGLLRGALRFVLSTQDDIDVVAERATLDETIAALRHARPDVTVLDMNLVGMDHSKAGRDTYHAMPDTKVLILVDPRRPGLLRRELRNPPLTVGFLAHSAAPEQVVDAVRRLARAERVLDAELVVAALREGGPLTAAELRVLQAARMGWPVKEIARELGLSPGTIRNHLSRILAKTGARTRIEAIHIAEKSGWF
jgi:two-component system response regulator DesR